MQDQAHIAELDRELNRMLIGGQFLKAFDRFYSDDVTMQENTLPPTVGKLPNRSRLEAFVASIETIHHVELAAVCGCESNVTLSEWNFDLSLVGRGRRITSQVAVRRWNHGKVVHERFYYSLR